MPHQKPEPDSSAVAPPELAAADDGVRLASDAWEEADGALIVVGIGVAPADMAVLPELVVRVAPHPRVAYVVVQGAGDGAGGTVPLGPPPLPIVEVAGETRLSGGTVHLLPPGRLGRLQADSLVLDDGAADAAPVDHFFASLAQEKGARGVGIVLTVPAEDGGRGAQRVKEAGGLALIRPSVTLDRSGQDGAPVALSAGIIGVIAEALDTHLEKIDPSADAKLRSNDWDGGSLGEIFRLLRSETGYDFEGYKLGTLQRRIVRRMRLHKCDSLSDYTARLARDANEVQALFKDLLISVTRFFRDPDAWSSLEKDVAPAIVAAHEEARPLRLWCAGCATGEEAYSLGMVFLEEIERQGRAIDIQVFATDIDESAIAHAREGLYPDGIALGVAPDRLARHFTLEGGRYRISQRLRQATRFAVQNVINEPPFANIDLISCRNVMIYLDGAMQARLVDLLHFALAPGGYLFVGASETLGGQTDLFRQTVAGGRIYRRFDRYDQHREPRRPAASSPRGREQQQRVRARSQAAAAWSDAVRNAMLETFVPPSVVVDRQQHVQFYQGKVHRFLEMPEGSPTTRLAQMVRDDARPLLRAALNRAMHGGGPAAAIVPRWGGADGSIGTVRVAVRALEMHEDGLFIVSFDEMPIDVSAEGDGERARLVDEDVSRNLIDQLESELTVTREELQTAIEELESSNEELKASNEEVISINEELQTSNEELQTSRTSLQSLNTELEHLNTQLGEKVVELEATNDDLFNLLSSTDIATIFLDTKFRIRRFTPATTQLLSLIDTDIGRPITDISGQVRDPRLLEDIKAVLARLIPREAEAENGDGRWFIRRALPYRTGDDKIAGVVLTYSDATTLKATGERLAVRERQQAAIARLGQIATHSDVSMDALLDEVVREVSERLGVPLVKILERHDASTLTLRAGMGWRPGLVGTAEIPAGIHSQGGYTLQSRSPVMVVDLAHETRFEAPELLTQHNVVSGISVGIGPVDRPWGVVGGHTTWRREFSQDDINFMQAIANIIWATAERQQISIARQEAAERLQIAIQTGRLATWDWDIATGNLVWSDGHFALLGYEVGEVEPSYDLWLKHVFPEDQETARAALDIALSGAASYHCEYRVTPRDGPPIWLEARGHAVFGEDGKPYRMYGVIIDIEERKRAEEQQSILLYELDHRVKNILANIAALARQTKSNAISVDGYVGDFLARLDAIARAHTLLSSSRWAGASLATLLEEELAAYRTKGRANIALSGPAVRMKPDDAQIFAIAFHELASNAAKYGALAAPEGRLDIRWRFGEGRGGEALVIDWVESGGPAVCEPTRAGFGATVLRRLVPAQTHSALTLDFAPEGLRCHVEIPRARLDVQRTGPDAGRARPGEAAAAETVEGKHVLIVEDSTLTAMDLEMLLEDRGALVVGIAPSLAAADAALDAATVDVAVVDRNLAGESTDNLARRLIRERIPFVFVTGYNDGNVPSDLVDVPLINKPFDVDILMNLLASVASRAKG
ncbi:CheR family methyltransferase [Acuticoccus kandeliae]|uniref:CheR family methyltransferase n=1 Tax=Acuticoccus kandeliae TaxID=2073160 RepID=UPI000D3EDFE0|nr:CheR family methyltransferase [Acuticoccus kandeliae]